MTKPFQKAMLITSIIYLVVGLVLIIWPDAARQIIIYAIGAAALIYGVYRIIDFFVRKEHLSGTIQLGVALDLRTQGTVHVQGLVRVLAGIVRGALHIHLGPRICSAGRLLMSKSAAASRTTSSTPRRRRRSPPRPSRTSS